MNPLPTFQSRLIWFLSIEMAVGSRTELKRLNTMLSVVTSKLEATQLETKLLQEEVLQLRDELHQARQRSDGVVGKENRKKVNNSGENKCSCEALTYVQDLIKIPSTSKELVKSIRQEKQLRKDFEMKTATRFFAMNEIIINMSQTCQSCSSKTDKDLSVEKMNSTLHGLLVNVEEIKSSIRNIQNDTRVLSSAFHSQSAIFATSSNTIRSNDAEIRRIASELEFVKGVIAYLSARG